MYSQFNTSSAGGGNTGSCGNLTNYLDKEQEHNWFNGKENGIQTETVKAEIDQNGKGQLGREDWKFVEVEYNPSQAEQQQIIFESTGIEGVTDWKQLTQGEQEKVKESFKDYVREAQDIQAKNYNREQITDGNDLKYYGKIETQRKYKGTDEAVKSGKVKQGDLKPGLNLHAHIVQSRKAADKKTKLSPTSKHRGASNKNKIQQGFDRNSFYNKLEHSFDKRYNYQRPLKQSFEWQKANKLNRQEEKNLLEKRIEDPYGKHRQEVVREHYKEREKTEQQQQQKEYKRSNNRGFSR